MPATAGRVRMPANNRVHSSAALQTHGIWQSAIGYDPYAPTKPEFDKSAPKSAATGAADRDDDTNAYASFQGLLALAKITGSTTDETRGACKKCGRVGHLTFQCRNFLSVKDQKDADEPDASIRAANEVMLKFKRKSGKGDLESDSDGEEESESESSDSDVDPEIERILAERSGKKLKKDSEKRGRSRHRKSLKRHAKSDDEESESVSEEEEKRKKRRKHREKKRRHRKDESDSPKERRKHKRRHRREETDESESSSSEEERKRTKRRRHREHRRKRCGGSRSGSESDDVGAERGRKERKRSHKMD